MASISHHVIRRQYLHVELNGTEADGFALQSRLAALYQDALAPAIERVLDRCGPVDGHLSIDRLDIDAGETTLERLEFAIAELVAKAIEKALREQVVHVQSERAIVAGNARLKTAAHSVMEAFVYFLKTGSLPWSFRLPKGVSLEQAVFDVLRDPVAADVIRRVLASEAARTRLTLQFSKGFLEALLSVLAPDAKLVLDRVLHLLRDTGGSIVETKHFVRRLWETTVAGVAEGRTWTPELLVHETIRSLPESFVVTLALADVLVRHWPGIDVARIQRPGAAPRKREPEGPRRGKRPRLAMPPGKSTITVSEHPEAKEGIYVSNAGVVLLHPFLPQLFSALGIASGEELLQPARALGLLHFLTTGELQIPEYELVLAKILCGVPLETSVEYDLDLSVTELDEATVLLGAVIRHWSALGESSPDALRGTFLLRPGKVSTRADGDWLLQVESQGFDILLDQLPWGFSTIQLPWMKGMLWVEWR